MNRKFFLTLALSLALLSGCAGGRSGTNSGNELKFAVVLEYRDAETGEAKSGVNTTIEDQEQVSGNEGTVAFEVPANADKILVSVDSGLTAQNLELPSPSTFDLDTTEGIFVEVSIREGTQATNGEIRVVRITPVKKSGQNESKAGSDDPVVEDAPGAEESNPAQSAQNQANGPDTPDKEDPDATPSPSATPEPEVLGLTAVVEGVVEDSNGLPIDNLRVAAGSTVKAVTLSNGSFKLSQAPVKMGRTGPSGRFIQLMLGGGVYRHDILVGEDFDPDHQKFTVHVVIGSGGAQFKVTRIPRPKFTHNTADISENETSVDASPPSSSETTDEAGEIAESADSNQADQAVPNQDSSGALDSETIF